MKENNLSKPSNVFLVLLVVIVAIVLVNTYSSAPNVPASSGQSSDSSKKGCDAVADTFFMNFHSNMNDTAFYNERGTSSSLVGGYNPIVHNTHKVNFELKPSFNKSGCLDYVSLVSEVDFGNDGASSQAEEDFCNHLLSLLKGNYENFTLRYDSMESNICIVPDMLLADRGTREFLNAVGGVFTTKELKGSVPDWVRKYVYVGTSGGLDDNGKLRKLDSYNNERAATEQELNLARANAIDIPKSAELKCYGSIDGSVKLRIIRSSYYHQDNFKASKVLFHKYLIIIDYSSKRYQAERLEILKKNKKVEQLKKDQQDSLERTNNQRL